MSILQSLYPWPDRPLLSLLVLLLAAIPFLYFAREPVHTLFRRSTRAIARPLRVGSRWLVSSSSTVGSESGAGTGSHAAPSAGSARAGDGCTDSATCALDRRPRR